MKLKALIAFVCVVATVFACSAFALAEESGIENAIPAAAESIAEDAPIVEDAPAVEEVPAVEEAPAVEDAPAVEEAPAVEDEAEEAVIERSEKCTADFNVHILDYINDSSCYYRSVKDVVADYGEDLYYPAYEGYENACQAYIIYAERGYADGRIGPKVLQIEYACEYLEICWIKIGATVANEGMNPVAEIYESHGAEFYISEYFEEGPNNYGGHIVEGVIEGNCYQFFVKTVEEGKLIVDSLTKAE